jgi:hypothetical protein
MTDAVVEPVRVCASEELVDGGTGIRRSATSAGGNEVVFFVRYDGQFFESSGLYLMCATHGAIYAPDTGKCVGGPCRGGRLRPVQVDERDTPEGRAVFWLPDGDLRPASA